MAKFIQEEKIWESRKAPDLLNRKEIFLGELILEKLKETPNRVCQISVEDNYELSCDELRVKSIRVAQNLLKIGIKSEDVVGIICRHSRQLTMALNGCVLIGAPVNPLDHSFTKENIRHMFEQTKPKIVICDSDQVTKVREALSELRNEAKIYLTTYENKDELNITDLLTSTGEDEKFVSSKFTQSSDEKILAILCSSGTTGSPKGVLISHLSILQYLADLPSLQATTRSVCFTSAFWISGFLAHLFLGFKMNDTRIMPRESFNIEKLIEIVEKYKPSELMVATISLSLILDSDFPRTVDHECLKNVLCSGAMVSETLRKKFEETFPEKDMNVVYGMTEQFGITATFQGDFKRALCVGTPFFPNLTFKIVDKNDLKLGVNEVGELRIKSEVKFLGYYNNPEESKNAVDDEGFLKTGDIGYIDENGKFYIIDRKKEIVKCKGYQVNLSEIESVIETMNGVKFVSVVGIQDPVYEILLSAVVVKREGFESISEKSIADFVVSKLQSYKHLSGGVYFIDQMPITASGKIKKRVLCKMVQSMC